ncbi:MAG: PP0621 family protein [Candidatus Thiodiazotropha sp.]
MGFRYLLLALAAWALYLIIRHLARQRKLQQPRRANPKAVISVQCAYCGLHLPREEALRRGDAYFCSQAHLDASKTDSSAD